MAFTYFDESAGSPVFDFRPFQSTARRMGIIPGNRLNDLLNELFPLGLQPRYLSEDFNWLFAQGIHAEPHFGDTEIITSPEFDNLDIYQLNAYDQLKVTIEYGTSQPGNSPDGQASDPTELLEHRWSAGGESLTIPDGGLEWADGTEIEEGTVDVTLLIPLFEMQLRWPRVENPPFSVIRDRIGSVNDDELNFKTGVAAPETQLFLGAEVQRTVAINGDLTWDVAYRFSERRVSLSDDDTIGGVPGAAAITVGGWNHIFRSEVDGKTGFYRINVKTDGRVGEGNPIYRLKSFTELFQQGP